MSAAGLAAIAELLPGMVEFNAGQLNAPGAWEHEEPWERRLRALNGLAARLGVDVAREAVR
jgi:hypothetical protein